MAQSLAMLTTVRRSSPEFPASINAPDDPLRRDVVEVEAHRTHELGTPAGDDRDREVEVAQAAISSIIGW